MTGDVRIREVAVVGASLAGLRAVETLRAAGFDGAITVIGSETHLPYDRPPLSKRLLAGEWDAERISLRRPDDMAALDVTWRLGNPAAELDVEHRQVVLADGSRAGFDAAVLATGAHPRRLAAALVTGAIGEQPVVLRTLDDALDLRARLAGGGRRVVVIGAGFIGLEVAATARTLGNEVLVLEQGPVPLARALGSTMGAAVAAVHADHGVEVRCGVTVEALEPGAVVVDGGRRERADVVVLGIGVIPSIDWLAGSGLRLGDGIHCAPDLNVGVPLIYAAGDIVRWHNALFDEEMRVEHWTNAAEQGALAASNLLAEAGGQATIPYAPVPFFWSEQYDRRIQFLGRASADDEVTIAAGSVAERQFVALYSRAGRLRGVLGMNSPRQAMPFRALLLERASIETALARL